MANIKIARVPIASHGLHRHSFNFPFLCSYNFMDVSPVHIKPMRKGESYRVSGGVFSRLNPLVNPAFATGRYNFKAFFVPFKYVFKPWYHFDQGTEYVFADGTSSIPTRAPFTTMGYFSEAIIAINSQLSDANKLFIRDDAESAGADFVYLNANNAGEAYFVTTRGVSFLKTLGALGYSPSWNVNDTTEINILPLLSYIRLFADYYFPSQYVGSITHDLLTKAIRRETSVYGTTYMRNVVDALIHCIAAYYDGDFLDTCYDNPVGSNSGVPEPAIEIKDNTNNYPFNTSDSAGANSVNENSVDNTSNANGTPSVNSSFDTSQASNVASRIVYRLNQYILDSLQSLNNYVQRHRLAGGRLLERFLTSRGITLEKDVVEMTYYLGEQNVEINIDAVENNTDQNLGELAGKGVASTDVNQPLKFECKADDDGIFFIVVSVIPDASIPIINDPWNGRTKMLDFLHSEFDKLGSEIVPTRSFYYNKYGANNIAVSAMNFGFHSRYYADIIDRPRLLGDFAFKSRGSETLNSFHTFRLPTYSSLPDSSFVHSLQFLNSEYDKIQYQRLFYSEKADNFHLFIRWFGDYMAEKLPLGDSFDWDDDEFNRKVEIVRNGLKV